LSANHNHLGNQDKKDEKEEEDEEKKEDVEKVVPYAKDIKFVILRSL